MKEGAKNTRIFSTMSHFETTTHYLSSPLGTLEVEQGRFGIRKISFSRRAMDKICHRGAENPTCKNLQTWFKNYFDHRDPSSFPWEFLDLNGCTDFQKSVWKELWRIPFGKVESYQSIAQKVGIPKAGRAVGQANGQNPFPVVIPCHRVIAAHGTMGGYSAGLSIKEFLLSHEGFGKDSFAMLQAIDEAKRAANRGEVPVGAVLVRRGTVLARAHNLRETTQNPLNHAEMILLERAAKKLKNWRLSDCTLYVTLEPCPMCLGALLQSRVGRLVFGCRDAKKGSHPEASLRRVETGVLKGNNHLLKITQGVLGDDCSRLLKEFFKNQRAKKGENK